MRPTSPLRILLGLSLCVSLCLSVPMVNSAGSPAVARVAEPVPKRVAGPTIQKRRAGPFRITRDAEPEPFREGMNTVAPLEFRAGTVSPRTPRTVGILESSEVVDPHNVPHLTSNMIIAICIFMGLFTSIAVTMTVLSIKNNRAERRESLAAATTTRSLSDVPPPYHGASDPVPPYSASTTTATTSITHENVDMVDAEKTALRDLEKGEEVESVVVEVQEEGVAGVGGRRCVPEDQRLPGFFGTMFKQGQFRKEGWFRK